jgi:nitrite reductase/ring-hydroxylating ferredoxin subunit
MMNSRLDRDRRVDDIPRRGARCVKTPAGRIAVFRTADDQVFASRTAARTRAAR